jgi:hypothetical protein
MNCTRISLPGGGTAIICGSKPRTPKCTFCYRKNDATLLCDAIVGRTIGGAPFTCDAPVCPSCAKEVGPNLHRCPRHTNGSL